VRALNHKERGLSLTGDTLGSALPNLHSVSCHLCTPGHNLPCCALWHLQYIYYPDVYLLWRRQLAFSLTGEIPSNFKNKIHTHTHTHVYIFENQVILEGFKFQLPEVRKKRC
jgi:hypothetical protein